VTFVVEEDVATDPLNVGFFCTLGVVFEAKEVADLIEEFFGWGFHDGLDDGVSRNPDLSKILLSKTTRREE
jgi:hypothetical protein